MCVCVCVCVCAHWHSLRTRSLGGLLRALTDGALGLFGLERARPVTRLLSVSVSVSLLPGAACCMLVTLVKAPGKVSLRSAMAAGSSAGSCGAGDGGAGPAARGSGGVAADAAGPVAFAAAKAFAGGLAISAVLFATGALVWLLAAARGGVVCKSTLRTTRLVCELKADPAV